MMIGRIFLPPDKAWCYDDVAPRTRQYERDSVPVQPNISGMPQRVRSKSFSCLVFKETYPIKVLLLDDSSTIETDILGFSPA